MCFEELVVFFMKEGLLGVVDGVGRVFDGFL